MFSKSERYADYQRTARPVVAMSRLLAHGEVTPPHRHRRGQLIHAARGVLTVETVDGIWVVPPGRAVWIPPNQRHGLVASGRSELQNVYVERESAAGFPEACMVLAVEPLLQALIAEAVLQPVNYATDSRSARVMALLLESIRFTPMAALKLPLPRDPRALRLALAVRASPRIDAGAQDDTSRTGASRRTLERLFVQETGMPFGRWRQQAVLLQALRMLAEGGTVADVAESLGYGDVAAFSAMFRRALGVPPSRYFA